MTRDVINFGCRLNAYESTVIGDVLQENGAEDIAVFNTCAVTKEAERQARQAIRKYHRAHPERRIIVTGCAAQINPKSYAALAGVDTVLGNEEKLQAEQYGTAGEPIRVNDIMAVRDTAHHLINGMEGKARAFMQVQNGCNHRCTFCIIPYGRGNSRSVPVGAVVEQARLLAEQGYQEMVLTGVDISDYGKDLPGQPSLGALVRRVLRLVPELKRLRLSSVDVAEIDDDLRRAIAEEERLMPHLHLSLQAGDDIVLKRMKRRHSRAQVLEFCDEARTLRPDIVFGADIIAGFPTETETMFENTVALVAEAGLTWLHVFPYSEREGTPAARIPAEKQVPVHARKARAARLRQAGQQQVAALLAREQGRAQAVLVESPELGRTAHYAPVRFTEKRSEAEIGTVIHAQPTGVTAEALVV